MSYHDGAIDEIIDLIASDEQDTKMQNIIDEVTAPKANAPSIFDKYIGGIDPVLTHNPWDSLSNSVNSNKLIDAMSSFDSQLLLGKLHNKSLEFNLMERNPLLINTSRM